MDDKIYTLTGGFFVTGGEFESKTKSILIDVGERDLHVTVYSNKGTIEEVFERKKQELASLLAMAYFMDNEDTTYEEIYKQLIDS